jgi:hypothetical protein
LAFFDRSSRGGVMKRKPLILISLLLAAFVINLDSNRAVAI